MELDIQLLNHNYIQKLFIFAILLYKRYRGQPAIYEFSVRNFLEKKIPFKIDYELLIPELSLEDRRQMALMSLLENSDFSEGNLITVHFKTGYKASSITIDLTKEDEYLSYLRS